MSDAADEAIFPYRTVYNDILQNYILTSFVTVSAQNEKTGEWLGFDAELDSIPGYSPVITRGPDGFTNIDAVSDVFDRSLGTVIRTRRGEEIKFLSQKLTTPKGGSDWTTIRKIIRHKYVGELMRLRSTGALLDVTPNHSIYLRKKGQKYGEGHMAWRLADASRAQIGDLLDLVKIKHLWPERGLRTGFFIGSKELAWLYGFFAAEGSAYTYCSHNYAVSLANKDIQLLEKAKRVFEANFHSRMLWSESRGVYKIYTRDLLIYRHFQKMFYTGLHGKKVPGEILNAPLEIQRGFLEGYNDGDGSHNEVYRHVRGVQFQVFTTNSQCLAQGLIWLIENCLGVPYTLNIRDDKPTITQINMGVPEELWKRGPSFRKDPLAITDVKQIPYAGYVYDFETADHTFQAGIGPVKVHNTGAMISVLPASAADLLGIDLTAGYPLALVGVGGGRIASYVHPITVRIGEDAKQLEIYAAFATAEVPPLLGRFTVFDQISQISLNNEAFGTFFSGFNPKPLPKIPWNFEAPPKTTSGAIAVAALFTPKIILSILFAARK